MLRKRSARAGLFHICAGIGLLNFAAALSCFVHLSFRQKRAFAKRDLDWILPFFARSGGPRKESASKQKAEAELFLIV
jgi:hypothetical protein